MEKIYKDTHHFNPYPLIHRYHVDGSITREWKGNAMCPRELKTDGSEKLEDLVEDIYRCFCFSGNWIYKSSEPEVYRAIYESKLPEGTELYQYHTGMVCQGVIESLETSELVCRPKTYYEAFEFIGIPCEYDDVKMVEDYIVWQYPDSVVLTLKAEDNKLFFGYSR